MGIGEIVVNVRTEELDKAIEKVNLLIERIDVLKEKSKGIIDIDYKFVEGENK